ncbi:hypothetical protein BC829DRAFT_388043 [Chytridium lagenaria]|nr:hypothetical protein BC829DRAFT_388043 [Chytridium lagenaria]
MSIQFHLFIKTFSASITLKLLLLLIIIIVILLYLSPPFRPGLPFSHPSRTSTPPRQPRTTPQPWSSRMERGSGRRRQSLIPSNSLLSSPFRCIFPNRQILLLWWPVRSRLLFIFAAAFLGTHILCGRSASPLFR